MVIILIMIMSGGLSKQYLFDNNAKDGKAEIEAPHQIDDEENFQFQIATTWNLENGHSEAEMMITNPADNTYRTSVIVTLDDSGEEVLNTEVLEPGDRIRYRTLSRSLARGSYLATAIFSILDLDSGKPVGKVAAQVIIRVAN